MLKDSFDWNHARSFLATADHGSFSAAAAILGISQPTLSRQVAALEAKLGMALFERVGRSLTITPNGLELLDFVRKMEDAAAQIQLTASGKSTNIEGSVCISATETAAILILPPILKKLRDDEPGIQIEIVATPYSSDLRKREADIALRHVKPTQSDLVAKKLPTLDAGLYATPEYLAKLGPISEPKDLAQACFIGFHGNQLVLQAYQAIGLHVEQGQFQILADNHMVHWAMMKQGAGIGIMPCFIAERDPDLMRVLPELPGLPFDSWLVTHRDVKANLRIRRVFDFLENELLQLFKN